MKYLCSLFTAIFLFTFNTQAELPKSSTLRQLNSEIIFDVTNIPNRSSRTNDKHPYLEGTLHLYYTLSTQGAVYYRGFLHDSPNNPKSSIVGADNIYAKFTRTREGLRLNLVMEYPDHYYELKFNKPYNKAELVSYGVASEQGNFREKNYATYWMDYKKASPEERQIPWGLSLKSELLPKDESLRFSTIKNIVGPAYFDPCDGCEHGDQLFITDPETGYKVNALSSELSKYYYSDCPGELDEILAKILEARLPLRYTGTTSSLTSDYWEGDFFMADQGTLYLGRQDKFTLVQVLDRVTEFVGEDDKKELTVEVFKNELAIFRIQGRKLYFSYASGWFQ